MSSAENRLQERVEEKQNEVTKLRLSLREKEREILALKRKLERAEKHIGLMTIELPESVGAISERVSKIENRIHAVERSMNQRIGALELAFAQYDDDPFSPEEAERSNRGTT